MDYNNKVALFCLITSDSTGGEASYTLDELNTLTWEKQLSLDSHTTDEDLNRYFSSYTSVHGTTAYFIKTRDDFATREFACYVKLVNDSTIFPTNTLNVDIDLNKLPTYDPDSKKYIIQPGTRFGFKNEESSLCEILTDDDHRDIEYTSIALISVEMEPNSVGYYMNSIDKVIPTNYTYTNDNALYQFVINSMEISRDAVIGDMSYKVSVTILPADMSAFQNTLYDDDYSGDIVMDEDTDETEVQEETETEETGVNIEKIRMYMLVDAGADHYMELKLNSELSSSDTGFIFQADIETDDIINDGTIQLLGLTSVSSQEIETFSVSMDNPGIKLLVFYDEGVKILETLKNAYSLYIRQTPSEKRKMLNYLLSNCTLEDEKVSYDYNLPFSYFVNFDSCRKKYPGCDSNA